MSVAQEPNGAGGSVGRGVLLTALAVIFGIFLLARALDGTDAGETQTSDTAAASEDDTSSDSDADQADGAETGTEAPVESSTTTSSTTTAPPPLVTHRPGEVKVAAVNGTGESGLAGAAADLLTPRGFVTAAKNAASVPVESSAVYYLPTYQDDAKVVATAVNAPADLLTLAPTNMLTLVANSEDVADFHIFVVLGTDLLIPVTVS